MGRPEPFVLFAQTILHSQLDEYVDEVLFAEPVVVTACEFLEQNASPSTPNISLIGATSPPSFALEVFVHCEGESRFRRLCQPFLYSHSSSNVLEVEAIVTNHLVLRGSYRSLTLVVYGNTAEDLGQFNIDLDLDSSLANVVYSPSEGKLEDLPPALHSTKLTFEGPVSSLKSLSLCAPELDISPEMKHFLLLTFKICQISDCENMVSDKVSAVVSAVSLYATSKIDSTVHHWDQDLVSGLVDRKVVPQEVFRVIDDARNKLLEIWKNLESVTGSNLEESCTELPTAELLVDMFNQSFPFFSTASPHQLPLFSLNKSLILALGLVLLLCSSRESCFHFVSGGGMEHIVHLCCQQMQKSTVITLLLLGIIECATRHGIGCEAYLGWWPRGDGDIPICSSDGYCYLLKLLLEKQRHDVASLATYALHRLRFYEILSRYECAVVSLLAHQPADCRLTADGVASLVTANSQLKQILKLINMCGPIDDPLSVDFARRTSSLDNSDGLLSYKATVNFMATSKYSFTSFDVDPYLLSHLKERGFFPLSAALLSYPILRSASGSTSDIFLEIASSIESILLSLLFCRSGFSFLLMQPEATELLILSLRDVEDINKTECMTLRQVAVLLSKGFFCRPQEIGMITELHLKVGTAVGRLLAATPNSDELLWVLWELCAISRSDSGRQALLALSYFPEAVSVLLDSLHSYKDVEAADLNSVITGAAPLSLAIFHAAAEIFEVMVTDSTASSLVSWIGLAVKLHKALHSSSPGSNRKDAPTRLLEWIDAGVIYHRNGAAGLLRYAAVLASGGDAHLSSTSVLVSDSIDIENLLGDSTNSSDGQVIDNLLGKFVSDKYFEGVAMRSSSIVQLTMAFRILAFVSEDPTVAASLFEEGAVTLVYVVLVNCKSMLERLSNSYDYLVDEGAEFSSTTDLLLDRSHEQSLVDLMIPSLVLLINLLQRLKETKEQYRNKKLLNALLQLHREVSPKLAASAADLSFLYPCSALGFGATCHLITSALACWPVFGWAPGLFHCLLENVQATSLLALGPKDACSLLSLLGDLFPDEGIWLWKNGIPPLSAIRTLSIGTVLGPQVESEINWYFKSEHLSVLLIRLTPQLDRIAQIVLHFATSALVVIQDMLRVLIIRIACQKTECAVVLLRPIISWLDDHVDETSLSDMDSFKVHQLLHFVASLSEHPTAKILLCKTETVRILRKVLQRCTSASYSEEKLILENRVPPKNVTLLGWRLPLLKSLAFIFNSMLSVKELQLHDEFLHESISVEESSLIMCHLLKLLQVLPVGRELLACAITFKEVISSCPGRSALALIFSQIQSSNQEDHEQDEMDTDDNYSNEYDWRQSHAFLKCWKKFLMSLDSTDSTGNLVIETVYVLSLSAICLALEGDNLEGIVILRCLFGLPYELEGAADSFHEKLNEVVNLIKTFEEKISENENLTTIIGKSTLHEVKEHLESIMCLLKSSSGTLPTTEGTAFSDGFESPSDVVRSIYMTSHLMPSLTRILLDDETALFFLTAWKFIVESEKNSADIPYGGAGEKFVWECSDSSLDRQLMPAQSARKKLAIGEGSGRRIRDNAGSEAVSLNAFSRGLNIPSVSAGPTRRDTFRQRKPNTSRPPSMHVDDYVARERNIDAASSGSNIVSLSQRGGSISGRPPSIHVDEFMARQRERQNTMPAGTVNSAQVKTLSLPIDNDPVKIDKLRQPKADLDDEQEIDIVFDEESGSDDKLPFPQPDDSLQSPLAIIGESSPGSTAEETEGDQNENSRFPQNGTPSSTADGNSRAAVASRQSVSKSVMPSLQDINIPPEKNPLVTGREKLSHVQPEESKFVSLITGLRSSDAQPSTNVAGFPSSFLSAHSALLPVNTLPPSNFYQRKSSQMSSDISSAMGSQAYGQQKLPANQPPLPSTPPPAPAMSAQNADLIQSHSLPLLNNLGDTQPPLPTGYPFHTFDVTGPNAIAGLQTENNMLPTGNSSSSNALLNPESKFSWNSFTGSRLHAEHFSSVTSSRPTPPLPPPYSTPPALSSGSPASVYNHTNYVGNQRSPSSRNSDTSLGMTPSSGTTISYSLPPFTPPLLISRPSSVPGSVLSSPPLPQGQLLSSLSQTLPNSQPSIPSLQPRPPPPPPPQLPHPSQSPQQPTHIHMPQVHSEQVIPFPQNSIHVQVPLQFQQQLHVPQIQLYYQQEVLQPMRQAVEQVQSQDHHIQADSSSQHQNDSGMTLQQYFASPEAIQSLLSDRDKLCQLLEQHPKLMQMLQERLGQL
ncbi:protein virilizer homolog isoform X2 [Typha angustifolia]|uniref:protein virilizer homolog isoform X2 n=1 Tax=Typha angustifolia TaxID=59011 RepID=UPI003C2E42BD